MPAPTASTPTPIFQSKIGSKPGVEPDRSSGKASTTWSGGKTLLAFLESSTDAFGPLTSAIGRLNTCINIYEVRTFAGSGCAQLRFKKRASKGRKDNEILLNKLKGLLDELHGCIAGPVGLEMTISVKRVCTYVRSKEWAVLINLPDSELAAEVEGVEKRLERKTVRQLMEALDESDEISECYLRIQSHLQRLTLNATTNVLKRLSEQNKAIEEQTEAIVRQAKAHDKQEMESRLKGMSPALSAMYNSAESDDIIRGECAPGTREAQIELLLQWASDRSAGKTYWLSGMAGTGKTTIAYSVCSRLSESFQLGASFFCSRVISECRLVKHIIPSIAYQLARFSFSFRCALDMSLKSDPDVHSRTLKLQYEKLIVGPLYIARDSLPNHFIVVIDALDECENENSLRQILDLFLSTASELPLRFLVSSRPEPEIYRGMTSRKDDQGNTQLVLHDLDANDVKVDIERYMRHELQHIPLTDAQQSSLTERCGVLFIYASTTCRYIEQGHNAGNLVGAVNAILGSAFAPMEAGDENTIDQLYSTILDAAFNKSRRRLEDKRRMKDALETVVCAHEPMALHVLAKFLGLESAKQVEALLQPLRSVLNIATPHGLVTTLHASFPDFMLSFGRSGIFHFVAASRNATLAERCLQIIDAAEPKFNICQLSSSYMSDNDVEGIEQKVSQALPPSLHHACWYWATYLHLGELRQELVTAVHQFFSERLLLWMEILNLTKKMRFGTNVIRDAEEWCQSSGVPENLTRIARDAWQFVSVYANHPISDSTPHIYVSMLAFWPRSRPVSVAYMPRTMGILDPTGTAVARRQPALLATWRISSIVYSMSLSSDGRRIAAATHDAVDLLDTLTGDGLQHIQGPHTKGITSIAMSPENAQIAFSIPRGVYFLEAKAESTWEVSKPDSDTLSIALSPDGSQLAVGLSYGSIQLYASQTGGLVLGPSEGHGGRVRSIAFSPNGLFIASGSDDKSVRIWDVRNGQMIGSPLTGHTHYVLSVSYSPDGTRLASASIDRTIRVWDPLTGQTLLGPIEENSSRFQSVTFSPNGAFIAAGSKDRTIRLYDAQTGQTVVGPLEGHTGPVSSVLFSPDSTQLFSCSHDGTIRLWNVQGLDVPNSIQPAFPSDFHSVRYLPNNLRIVSGSSDGSVCVWDVLTGEMVLGPLKGHSEAVVAVDCSPNNAYIASACSDFTLRIWGTHDGRDMHGPIQGHTGWVNCVRFSPDGSLLVSGSSDCTLRVWDVSAGKSVIKPLKKHSRSVYSVAFSPNGALVVSGSSDCTIRVWDISTGQTVVGPFRGHKRPVSSVEFSPDSSRIFSGSWDGSVRVWNARTGRQLLVCGKDQTYIYSASVSPDGLLVASACFDNTTQIWDAQTGDLILTLEGHSGRVLSVQFSPNGSRVVSCSLDGTIRFWDVSRRIANLQLTQSKGLPRHIANLKLTRPKGLGEVSVPMCASPRLGPWSLDKSGWLANQHQQRLVWVPEDLRISTPRHPNDFIICKQGHLKLDFNGVYVGEQWVNCYQP